MTVRRAVYYSLCLRTLQTAAEIHNHYSVCEKRASLATVASMLNKLARGGFALRVKGYGPRGGYGYVRTRAGEGVI